MPEQEYPQVLAFVMWYKTLTSQPQIHTHHVPTCKKSPCFYNPQETALPDNFPHPCKNAAPFLMLRHPVHNKHHCPSSILLLYYLQPYFLFSLMQKPVAYFSYCSRVASPAHNQLRTRSGHTNGHCCFNTHNLNHATCKMNRPTVSIGNNFVITV